jgi:hypothetical protein
MENNKFENPDPHRKFESNSENVFNVIYTYNFPDIVPGTIKILQFPKEYNRPELDIKVDNLDDVFKWFEKHNLRPLKAEELRALRHKLWEESCKTKPAGLGEGDLELTVALGDADEKGYTAVGSGLIDYNMIKVSAERVVEGLNGKKDYRLDLGYKLAVTDLEK